MAGTTIGKCVNYGGCDVADRDETVEIAPGGDGKCPECGKQLQVGNGRKPFMARIAGAFAGRGLLIGGVVAALLLIGGIAWAVVGSGIPNPFRKGCDVAEVRTLIDTDPKQGELEEAGLACLEAGQSDGDAAMLATASLALRLAADKGSTAAAYAMGRLFDPLVRDELEKDAKVPQLLPTADPAIALQYYDKAAAGEPEARSAAERLRSKFPALRREAANADGTPLTVPGYEDIFQRALVKPGAVLVSNPGGSDGMPLETFDIVYVFGVKPGWRRVGHSLDSGPEGWVAEGSLQNWNVMLTMRYAPQGTRNPALFFKDETAAKGLLLERDPATAVATLIAGVRDGKPDPRLAALEDKSVDWRTSPYMMPILRTAALTADDGRTIYLAEVASVAGLTGPVAAAPAAGGGGAAAAGGKPAYCRDASIKDAVHQIVFVIDTTSSMGPYIDGVKRIAETWRDEIARRGLGAKFRFGVVAYRNNMDAEPQKSGLEYVTRTALPLSQAGDAATFASVMGQLRPATVSTHAFDEDPVSGLEEAMAFDWSQGCGVRMMFLVTDAGALKSDDPKTRHVGTGLSTIAARAHEMNIEILPVHLQTREARQAGDVDRAAAQYRGELDTAEGGNYQLIADGSPAGFDSYLRQVGTIIDAVDKERRGQLQSKPPTQAAGETAPSSVQATVLGKLFAAQQRFVGALAGATAPTFVGSWTSDRDLGNLDQPALEVSVLLTRRQLNQLAEKTDYLVRSALQAKTESSRFFSLLRMVSAATAQDPKRFANDNANLGALMPSFLRILPYKSDVLAITADDWRGMGPSKQDAFIRRLQEKLSFYRKTDADQSSWRSLGGTDPAEAVALIPLKRLP